MQHTTRRQAASFAPGQALAALWDRLVAADPGLIRLTMAARGTLAVLLMSVVAIVVGEWLHTDPLQLASGVILALMVPFVSREPTVAQRRRTLLVQALACAVATLATGLLHGLGDVEDGFFLLLVFLCFLLQGRSPMGVGLGFTVIVTVYVDLFLELPPAALPVQLLSVALAVPVTAFACFVLVPLRPHATLRRTVRALQGRAAVVLRDAGGLAAHAPGRLRRLRRSLARLNEAALAADDLLALLDPACSTSLRAHLLDLELAAARLATAPLDAVRGAASRRQAVRLAVHERRLRRNRWLPRGAAAAPQSSVALALADLARAASALGRAELPRVAVPPASPPPAPFAWRLALRVTLASALAMVGGMAVSQQRWFWAVISTYVVFLNTRSRGDALFKGAERLAGTLLGLFAGVALADVLGRVPYGTTVVLLLATFGMYYLFLVSYTLGIFCATVLLGLLYALLGAATGPLLMLRLEETAVGAAAAVLVAALVLPVRTREQVRQSGRGVLAALAAAVAQSRRALAGEADAAPVQAMRALDRQVADLRLALLPLSVGRLLLHRAEVERPVPALLDSVHWARTLAVAAATPDAEAAAAAACVERRLLALAAGERPAGPIPPAQAGVNPAQDAVARLDRATAMLAEHLAIGALHAFRLET